MNKSAKGSVTCRIGSKTVIWVPLANKYVLASPPLDELVRRTVAGGRAGDLAGYCRNTLGMEEAEAIALAEETGELLAEVCHQTPPKSMGDLSRVSGGGPPSVFSEKHYRMLGRVFRVAFASAQTESMIHPLFAHLEIPAPASPRVCFGLGHSGGQYGLAIDGEWVGAWPEGHGHILIGQFSLHLLEAVYGKRREDWMAVLHAAGVSNGRHCLIFAGESGAGKSTLSSLLLARGLDVLADDFLALESAGAGACRFPAAISVKEPAFDLLTPSYPELARARTFHYPALGKTVRYLPAVHNGASLPAPVPCRGIVLVQYEPEAGLRLEEMPPEDAFAQLVPGAWIHPSSENARKFLEWFSGLPTFRLVYSDNARMAAAIEHLLHDPA